MPQKNILTQCQSDSISNNMPGQIILTTCSDKSFILTTNSDDLYLRYSPGESYLQCAQVNHISNKPP